ncbi:uncharacterized protein [Lepisosteus oculatus]|uniref:uncharacterized protein isoform X3 n=1 Tax=Lepisosteus oculatus TaxID=7918 RepID=UPI0035F524FF
MRTLTVLGLLAAVWGALRTEGFSVQGPREPLVARPGDEVLLPCSVDSTVPLQELEVEWLRTDPDTLVLLFSEGESRPESQHQSYRGRAELFPQEIPRGNFSLWLANVTAEDSGVYRCAVHTAQGSGETTVELKEKKQLEVEWLRTDSEVLVLLFSEGESRPESQHQSYRGRAELFPQEIPRGNFSLRLKDVRTEEKGQFVCRVFGEHESAEATAELIELGFSSIHVGALLLAFSAPVLWMLMYICICFDKRVLVRTFLFAPSVLLSISFVLWGVTEGSLEEVIMCVTVNLLRNVPVLSLFNVKNSVSISFSIINFVVITVMWSVALWEYFKSHTPDTSVKAGFGLACTSSLISSLCGIYIQVYSKWRKSSQSIRRTVPFTCSIGSIVVFILFRASIERLIVGYLTVLIVALIALVVSLTLQRICSARGRCGDFCQKAAVVIFSMILFVLSLLYLASDLDTLRGGPGLMCEVLFLWILAVGTVFTKEDRDVDGVLMIIFNLGYFGLPLVNSTALATELILKATKGYRAVKDLRLVVVPCESLFVICGVVRLMYNYYKNNKNKNNKPEIEGKLPALQTLLQKQERDSNRPEEERSPGEAQLNKESD